MWWGYLYITLLQISYWVWQWKNFKNRLIFGKVMGKSSVFVCFLTHGVECCSETFINVAFMFYSHSYIFPQTIQCISHLLFRCCTCVFHMLLKYYLLTYLLTYNTPRKAESRTVRSTDTDWLSCGFTCHSTHAATNLLLEKSLRSFSGNHITAYGRLSPAFSLSCRQPACL